MRLRSLCLALPLVLALPDATLAVTARDLSARIRVDGFTTDYQPDEVLFGFSSAANAAEEASDDSRWGVNEDVNQIRITWDAQFLYVAGEGRIWDNNMVLLFDTVPDRGLTSMTQLNSWRRNFDFDTTSTSASTGFSPDLFAATWDGNTSPRLIVHLSGNQVDDQRVGATFNAAATFSQGNRDRAMELRIPWRSLFLGSAGLGTRDTFMTVGGVADTFHLFPPGTKIKICAVVTASADGTGGPDSAPDNLRGHTDSAGDLVLLDNWAIVDLDRTNELGVRGGAPGPDGVADWGVAPKDRITFRYQPPIVPLRFAADEMLVDRPAFSPDAGQKVSFKVRLDKRLNPEDPISKARRFNLSANIFDLRGRRVRTLYQAQTRYVIRGQDANDSFWDAANESDLRDTWDGRDDRGTIVPAGIYVIRTAIEPNLSRALRSVVVVR